MQKHVHCSPTITQRPHIIRDSRRPGVPAPHSQLQNYSMSSKSSPLAKYDYRRRLPNLQKSDAELFITFCTNRHLILSPNARDLVFEHFFCEARIRLLAAVVMPDHVHLMLVPLRDRDGWPFPLVDILQCLKSVTAHRINKLFGRSGPLWEEESFDHVLRSHESLKMKCEYIRQNPVVGGLVQKPEEYRWLMVDPQFR
jgi:REP element-mobilizing transposase RayT